MDDLSGEQQPPSGEEQPPSGEEQPSGKDQLLQLFAYAGPQLWTILPLLASTPEPTLRDMLRPHDETGLSRERDAENIELRARLDRALDALTLLEIAYETGVLTLTDVPVPALGSLRILFGSGAVLRYVNAYLFFSIRFLAYRLEPDSLFARPEMDAGGTGADNRHFFALVAPPSFAPDPATGSNFGEFITPPPAPWRGGGAQLSRRLLLRL